MEYLSRIRNKNYTLYAIRYTLVFLLSGCAAQSASLETLYSQKSQGYETMLAAHPEDKDLRMRVALFYYGFKDYQSVVDVLGDETTPEAKAIRAKALARLKDYTAAIQLFEDVGELDDAEYLFLYGQTLEAKNLFDKAKSVYAKVKAPYAVAAASRLNDITLKTGETVPGPTAKLLEQEKDYIQGRSEDEAVIVSVDERLQVNPDNTSLLTSYCLKKILNEKGKENSEIEIGYDSTYEKVELEYARTITPAGLVIGAGKENIRDVSKYLNFPLYSNARALIISMPAVEVGCAIEYKVKIHSAKLIDGKRFSMVYPIQDSIPIASARFELDLPAGSTINRKVLNQAYVKGFSAEARQETGDGQDAYIWEFQHLAPIIPEDRMPPVSFIDPAVAISNFDSWREVYDWWQALFKDKLDLPAPAQEMTAAVVKQCGDDDICKATRLYEFASRQVRYVAVEYGDSGYEPHPAAQVFANRYGDCKDKAILLVAFLRSAGITAYPALVATRETYQAGQDFPSAHFNHAIAAVELDPKYAAKLPAGSLREGLLFMDATASTVSFGDLPVSDQDRQALVFAKDGPRIVTIPKLPDNSMSYVTSMIIDAGENASVERTIEGKGAGAANQRYYFIYSHPSSVRDNIRSKMLSISPFSRLKDYKIENAEDFSKPPTLRYSFESAKILNPAGSLRMLPFMSDIDIDPGYASKDQRDFAIDFPGRFASVSTLKVSLPAALKIKYLPPERRLSSRWFDYSAVCASQPGGFQSRREFTVKGESVEPQDYLEFKRVLEEVFFFLKEEIILEKNETKT